VTVILYSHTVTFNVLTRAFSILTHAFSILTSRGAKFNELELKNKLKTLNLAVDRLNLARYIINMSWATTNQGENKMNAKMTAEEFHCHSTGDNFLMKLVFSGGGWSAANKVDFDIARQQFADAEKLGMAWDRVEYVAVIPATRESAEPFQRYADGKGIELILK
jgi:hypothetical protein